jgi:hypothetical protein
MRKRNRKGKKRKEQKRRMTELLGHDHFRTM